MRTFEYCLLPESGYDGDFDRKEGHFKYKSGTVADLIIDTGILSLSDFDKVIPPLSEFNEILLRGDFPRLGEWKSFEICENEYNEMAEFLTALHISKPYRKYNL